MKDVGNAMIYRLSAFSKTNMPLMLRKEMETAVSAIWKLSNRNNTRKFMIGACVDDILAVAQDKEIDSLLVCDFDYFTPEEQIRLCTKLMKSDTQVRGKFIFLVSCFDQLLPQVKDCGICKITFCFQK